MPTEDPQSTRCGRRGHRPGNQPHQRDAALVQGSDRRPEPLMACEITIDRGRVVQSNYRSSRRLKLTVPRNRGVLQDDAESPTGLATALAADAPAVCNAISRDRQRIRLPVDQAGSAGREAGRRIRRRLRSRALGVYISRTIETDHVRGNRGCSRTQRTAVGAKRILGV
jgi:hypothetical protein